MNHILSSIEKVNQLLTDYLKRLQNAGVDNVKVTELAMYLLCKVKGNCGVLNSIEEELLFNNFHGEGLYNYIYEADFKDVISKIKDECGNKINEIIPAATEMLIQRYYTNSRWGEYIQSQEITELVLSLLKENHFKTLYNPFAGLASYGLADFVHEYRGQEINPIIANLAKMRLELNNGDYRQVEKGDSISDWNTHGADCIVSTPPFGLRINKIPFDDILSRSAEEYVMERFIRSRSKHAYIVMSCGVCFNSNSSLKEIRKQIVEGNMLEMVIELPSAIYSGSGVSTCLVVLNKERKDDDPVLFIDATECFILKVSKEKILDAKRVMDLIHSPQNDCCSFVSINEIRKKKYIWSVGYYLKAEEIIAPQGYEVRRLRDILKPIAHNRSFSEKKGRLVRISDLSSDYSKFIRTADSFEESDKLANTIMVEEPVLLLSSIRVLKPTFCKASPEEPIFVHPHLYAYKIVFQGISPEYLCLELSKKKLPFLGVTIPRVSRDTLLDTQVAYPPLNEQLHIFQEALDTSNLNKVKELGLQNMIHKMKAEYMMEVRNRKHDMKTPMTQLRNTLTLIDALAKTMPSEYAEKLMVYIGRQKTALDSLSSIVQHLADEDVFSDPEPVDINDVISQYKNSEVAEKYDFIYVVDTKALREAGIKKPLIKVGKAEFVRVVQNIISNAVMHGFVGKNKKFTIEVTLSVDEDNFIIGFTNNGKPIPSGMDKNRYGMRGVKGKDSNGDGIGGHIVKSVTEQYGGDYDIFTRKYDDEVFTTVLIKFPIYRDEQI